MMNEIENKDYLQTLISLKQRVLQEQYNSYSAVNSEMILAYLDIGKTISEKTKTGWVLLLSSNSPKTCKLSLMV